MQHQSPTLTKLGKVEALTFGNSIETYYDEIPGSYRIPIFPK